MATPNLNVVLPESLRAEVRRLGERYRVRNIRVFGSSARGDAGPESDVDLLVEYVSIGDLAMPHGGDMDLRQARDALTAIGRPSIKPTIEVLAAPCGTPVGRNSAQ